MREKNRKPIASYIKLPQFTTMNVIDGQAGLIIYASLIFYSLTIDNILNIIVLLILAGVTIATLTGDNGLLTKAGNVKNASEEATALEKIQIEVAGSYGLDGKIDIENQLNQNLKRINGLKYNNSEIDLNDSDKRINNLPATVEVDGYKYDILENGKIEKTPDYNKLKSMYGNVLKGYDAGKNLENSKKINEWRLFYVDEENREVFIIAQNRIPATGIPTSSSKNSIEYVGTNSFKELECDYGIKYNQLWLSKCTTENTAASTKAVLYLCDPKNWEDYYIGGKAKYAVGGPTEEIFVASFYNVQVKDLNNESYNGDGASIRSAGRGGYPQVISSGVTQSVKEKLYNVGSHYWIASPSGESSHVRALAPGGDINYYEHTNGGVGYRPLVCIPASSIKINENELSI